MTSRELMQQWVDDLRSDNYIQGFSYLKQSRGALFNYCSLGVGFQVLAKNGLGYWVNIPEDGWIPSVDGARGTRYTIPWEAEELLGIRNWHQSVLIDMNDDGRVPFPRQARWLEDEFLTDRRPK